jgi:two-component system NtrC family sensor kinase
MDEELRILCVDDEKNVLKALERIFIDSDYEIITALSGNEGLKILENTEPVQIIISDYRMPGMNGIDFLKEARKLRPDTVRIVLSGYANIAAIVGAINEGQIYKFIPKPWNDDELKIAISNAFGRYFIQKKNIELAKELEVKNNELKKINNNLKNLLEERTFDLMLQETILTSSQNILHSLPVGVIGLDPEGLIVQCNQKGLEVFNMQLENTLGMDRNDLFSEEINDFIERVMEKGTLYECISDNGVDIRIKGVYLKSNNQEGIILVCDKVETDG